MGYNLIFRGGPVQNRVGRSSNCIQNPQHVEMGWLKYLRVPGSYPGADTPFHSELLYHNAVQ